ncbi:MAG TPA: CDP-alcohol phosphatidyltransferase family protein [Terriglobia bacterium]|nr:CDP-alcohol phosphatidyltransferase family protein [Terriglobia bacterium]
MPFFSRPAFCIHLLTLSGLALAFSAIVLCAQGNFDAAARALLVVLVIDHLDGTLARHFRVREKIPEVSGETIDLVTDIAGLTFAPMFLFYSTGVFLPGWALPVCLLAVMTCSLKYAMKQNTLQDGYTLGAPPVYYSVFLLYFLHVPQIWATMYALALTALCLLPIRYPITSIVTTHWKPGWQSITNYLSFLAMPVAFICLDKAPAFVYWILFVNVLAQLLVMPLLLALGVVQPGLRRVY